MGIALAATAFTSLAGIARADETEVSLSYTNLSLDVPIYGQIDGDATTLDTRGKYDNGLRYDASFTWADVDGVGETGFGEINGSYMFGNFGPAVSYVYADESEEDVFGIGFSAELDKGPVETYASLTSDVDNFGDAYRFDTGIRFDVAENVLLRADYQNTYWGESERTEHVELGARYTLMNDVYIDASFGKYYDMNDVDVETASLGLGLQF